MVPPSFALDYRSTSTYVDGDLILTTTNQILNKAVMSAFCHKQSRRSHWARQQPVTQEPQTVNNNPH